jgi:SNF2 family DNA or RNA helicase
LRNERHFERDFLDQSIAMKVVRFGNQIITLDDDIVVSSDEEEKRKLQNDSDVPWIKKQKTLLSFNFTKNARDSKYTFTPHAKDPVQERQSLINVLKRNKLIKKKQEIDRRLEESKDIIDTTVTDKIGTECNGISDGIREYLSEMAKDCITDYIMSDTDYEWITKKAKQSGLKEEFVIADIQLEAIQFVLEREKMGSGSLLASGMGMGKTLMTLVTERISNMHEPGTTLIIAPNNIKLNWVEEVNKFFGNKVKVLFYRGEKNSWLSYGGKNGEKGVHHNSEVTCADISRHDLVITHYESLATTWKTKVRAPIKEFLATLTDEYLNTYDGDKGKIQRSLMMKKFPYLDWSDFQRSRSNSQWVNVSVRENNESVRALGAIIGYNYKRIVLDEGHTIKNPKACKTQMACGLRSSYNLILTGTPTINSFNDLWPQFKFIKAPHVVDFQKFQRDSKQLCTFLRKENKSLKDKDKVTKELDIVSSKLLKDAIPSFRTAGAKRIVDLLDMWMHRRTNNEVAMKTRDKIDLLEEECKYMDDEWTLTDHSIDGIPCAYRKVIKLDSSVNMMAVHESLRLGQKTELNALVEAQGKKKILDKTITSLRVLISDPEAVREDLYEDYCDKNVVDDLKREIPLKIQKIIEYKNSVMRPGEKGIIFVYFLKATRKIEKILREFGIECIVANGEMKTNDRWKACKRWIESKTVTFLIASMCLGEGVNLVAGNHVIIYDMWWNFPKIKQAIARSHRRGQENDVFVLFLVLMGTIDEKIWEVAERKENYDGKLTSKMMMEILGF